MPITDPEFKNSDARSPVPTKKLATMSFPEALKLVIEGKKISKLEWESNTIYAQLKEGWLALFTDGQGNRWTINEGDLLGVDWFVLPE